MCRGILGQLVRWYSLLHFVYLINVANYGYKVHKTEELIGFFLKTFIFYFCYNFFFNFVMSGEFKLLKTTVNQSLPFCGSPVLALFSWDQGSGCTETACGGG